MLSSSQVVGTLTLPALLTPKIEVSILNREDAIDYVNAYRKAYGQDPSDVDIKGHLECTVRTDDITWLNPHRDL